MHFSPLMFQKVAILAPFKKNGYFYPLTFGPLLISWFYVNFSVSDDVNWHGDRRMLISGVQTCMVSKLISGHSLGGPKVTPCQFELHLSASFYPHDSLHHQRLRNCHNLQQNQLIKREPKVRGVKISIFLKGAKIATFWNIEGEKCI